MLEDKLNELLKISKTVSVLYVEDKEEVRVATTQLLERIFGEITVAIDGRDGIKKYLDFYEKSEEYYDLVISDIDMPRMNGIDMCRAITEVNKKQVILVVSAYSNSEMFINLIDLGVNKFLQKPSKDYDWILMLNRMVNDIDAEKKSIENIQNIQETNINLKKKINSEIKKGLELNKLATTDKLTSLFNRAKLDKVLDLEISRTREKDSTISVIFIDIDRFKAINDAYGHQVGDKVLKEFSKALQDNVRKTDTIGRWGGEEFLVICQETTLQECLFIAENLRSKIQNMNVSTVETITASFGVASLADEDTALSLLQRADSALYKSKENGRNIVSS